jgi:hypothetical protein
MLSLQFAPATPPPVRRLLEQAASSFDTPSSGRLRRAVARLAGNEEMESFWRTIPPQLRGHETEIIAEALIAYDRAIRLRPPVRQHCEELKKFVRKHQPISDPEIQAEYRERFVSPPTYAGMAVMASELLDDLREIPKYARTNLPELWACDPGITFNGLLGIVEAIAAWGWRLHNEAEARQAEAPTQLPKLPLKRGSLTAQQVYFSRLMQDYFRREFSRPMAGTIAILAQVMFDLPDAVDESTILKRR